MHLAIRLKDIKAIKLLLEKDASLAVKNKMNKSPFEIADDETQKFISDILNQKKVFFFFNIAKILFYFYSLII